MQREVLQKELVSTRASLNLVLLLLLAGSGCAALIYEIVWLQLLQLVIGSSAVSLGLLLAAYMGGLCLGSAAFPRLVSDRHHPLRVYALLELGVALFGILALLGIPLVGRIYVAGVSEGIAGLALRAVVAGACLVPPTLLMGGSFPAISRLIRSTSAAASSERASGEVSWLGWLYSSNIAGAVLGCVLAGFYLLRVFDMAVATYAAAAINLAVALLSYALANRSTYIPAGANAQIPSRDRQGAVNTHPQGTTLVYIAIALSGLCALGAEVVWTRLLSLLLGPTVYTFSIILAVFLLGLWAGSSVGALITRRLASSTNASPCVALAACQILIAISIAWTAFAIADSLPQWPIDPWLSLNPWANFQIDWVRCVWAIFPATLLWGASFPLGLAAISIPGQDPAQLSGLTYAINTVGSIIGALAFSLILIPSLGTRVSEQLLIGLSVAAAVISLASSPASSNAAATLFNRRAASERSRQPSSLLSHPVAMSVAAVLLSLLAWGLVSSVSDVPWAVIAYGRRIAPTIRGIDLLAEQLDVTKILFRGEGMNSSVLISERSGQRSFYVSGKSEASTAPGDMRLERMMGDVPALIHSNPRSILIVGFGAGVTAGSFVPYPEVEKIVICELERMIPPASTQFFGPQNYGVMNDERTRIVYDDARHYILTTPEKYDVITTDPIHPWVKGTSTLYSKEYYELAKSHLNPHGVVAQWLPIYESDEETVKTELATFFRVFPEATVWSNYLDGDGYDLVLVGRADSAPIDVDGLQQRLDQSAYSRVSASLAEVGYRSAADLMAAYGGRAPDLQSFLVNAPINEDLNLRLQYMAGLGLNARLSTQIYRDILMYRKFPEGLMTGSSDRLEGLRDKLGRPHLTF